MVLLPLDEEVVTDLIMDYNLDKENSSKEMDLACFEGVRPPTNN
jgi:hypothetical protein